MEEDAFATMGPPLNRLSWGLSAPRDPAPSPVSSSPLLQGKSTVLLCVVFVANASSLYCAGEQLNISFSSEKSQQLVKKKKKVSFSCCWCYICLEKASGWVLITLAIELGCQLASSGNCFPWQDPVGWEKRRAMQGINTGIHFLHSSVIIVPRACRYLLPIGMRAKLWLTPIDWWGQGVQWGGGGEGLEGLECPCDCHSKWKSETVWSENDRVYEDRRRWRKSP